MNLLQTQAYLMYWLKLAMRCWCESGWLSQCGKYRSTCRCCYIIRCIWRCHEWLCTRWYCRRWTFGLFYRYCILIMLSIFSTPDVAYRAGVASYWWCGVTDLWSFRRWCVQRILLNLNNERSLNDICSDSFQVNALELILEQHQIVV